MSERRPGTTPYFLTPTERDMLVEFVRGKASKANGRIARSRIVTEGAVIGMLSEPATEANEFRELLYALGASPTSPLIASLKGALHEDKLSRYRKNNDAGGPGVVDAEEALTFLKVYSWTRNQFQDGRLGVFLIPRPGAEVRVLLSGPYKEHPAIARNVPMHELPALFASVPIPASTDGLLGLGFISYPSWDAAIEAP